MIGKIILDTTSQDYGHAVRSVHAKGHGVARGRLDVAAGLPPELAQGLFAAPASYEAVFRLSTNAGDILDDSIMLPRGLALKIIGVDGERLPGSEGPYAGFRHGERSAFAGPDSKKFLGSLKRLAKTTDKAQGAKKALSAVFRAAESALEALGGESSFLKLQSVARVGRAPAAGRR